MVERTEIVQGLDAPWDMEFMGDGSLLVTERDRATITRFSGPTTAELSGPGADAIRNMTVTTSEGGLLGMAPLPSDPSVLYVYVTRAEDNAVLRMRVLDNELSFPVEVVTGIPSARNHDGGRIAFGPDGYLYITTGDAGDAMRAQDPTSLAGKILRVVANGTEEDGTPAPENPFDSQVWSLGHRNVEGIDWAPNGRMFASEFGQNAYDELNLIEPGSNYGWPLVESLIDSPDGTRLGDVVDGLTYPVEQWSTDEASPSGIAVTYEAVYMAALRGEALWRIPLTETGLGQPERIVDDLGRIRDVAIDPDGRVCLMTNNTDGRGKPRNGDDRIICLTLS